jgi:glycosyltransferase involved in cell wall biosynthesis
MMNMYRLIEAFAALKQHFPRMKLAKIGEAGSGKYRWAIMRKLNSLGLTESVIFIEPTSPLELAHYYSSAALLIYPPLYEGFALPPLEAMACGCPVVASNTSSLPEIIGDGGLIADARDTPALANAMREVISDLNLRNDLIRRGLEQAKKFSWQDTAEQTQEVYMKVAREHNLVSVRVQ